MIIDSIKKYLTLGHPVPLDEIADLMHVSRQTLKSKLEVEYNIELRKFQRDLKPIDCIKILKDYDLEI